MPFQCPHGCKMMFRTQVGLDKHCQTKHLAMILSSLQSTSIFTNENSGDSRNDTDDLRDVITPYSNPTEYHAVYQQWEDQPEAEELESLEFERFYVPPAAYGIPINNRCYTQTSLIQRIKRRFSKPDIDVIQHVILDNPQGQNAITLKLEFDRPRLLPQHVPTFKTGKELHQALDSFDGLSVDYVKLTIKLDDILASMPRQFHAKARVYYTNHLFKTLYTRPISKVIETKLRDPSLKSHFKYCYEEQRGSNGERLYEQAYSSNYCKTLQGMIPPGGTLLLLIFGSDAALATKIGKQSFHPFTLDFGNIDKEWRKSLSHFTSTLITYLPVLSPAVASDTKSEFFRMFRRAVHHAAVRLVLSDIQKWIETGSRLVCPDGKMRHVFPALFNFNGDYPELTLMATVKPNNKHSPMPCCWIPKNKLSLCGFPCSKWGLKTSAAMARNHQNSVRKRSLVAQKNSFASKGQFPYVRNAFYDFGPRFCIHSAITADPLHTIYIGIFGFHLWKILHSIIEEVHGQDGLDAVDSRFRSILPYPGFNQYMRGVVKLEKLTKKDYASIMMQILPCIYDLVPVQVTCCLRTFLDITMLVSSTCHSDLSLSDLQDKLCLFQTQIEVFRPFKSMDFPKMHILASFVGAIQKFGAADSFGTETLESTQRSNVVKAYLASNHKDSAEQMIRHITRIDKAFAMKTLLSHRPQQEQIPQNQTNHRLLGETGKLFLDDLDNSSNDLYHGFSAKLGFYVDVNEFSRYPFFNTLRINDFDEDGKEYKSTIHIQAGDGYCIYTTTKLRPPVLESGLGGSVYLLGLSAHFLIIQEKSFAVLQRFRVLEEQNLTGLFIVEPVHSLVIVPISSIVARAHVIPYFQDGQGGKSGKYYLNTYADRYLWTIIPSSVDRTAAVADSDDDVTDYEDMD
ncbi:hypothetical protein BDR26DRAFT_969998 [Obelidium mucronatum]|nr:hypothetical protein BDR26DRAFT_969998 [Obelidium mucronatum]